MHVPGKMMTVDDRFALIGSANINDRSLLGARDSELAVLVMDEDNELRDTRGNGKPVPTRNFARELRKGAWSKLFGLTGGERPAEELREAIDRPAHRDSWRKIQEVAKRNTAHYDAAFRYIPRNWHIYLQGTDRLELPASIWPTADVDLRRKAWAFGDMDQKKFFRSFARIKMPFEREFWDKPQWDPTAITRLDRIRGYITSYPVSWTAGENNNMKYHMALMTHHDQNSRSSDPLSVVEDEALAKHAGTEQEERQA